jgi:hypothetical protein
MNAVAVGLLAAATSVGAFDLAWAAGTTGASSGDPALPPGDPAPAPPPLLALNLDRCPAVSAPDVQGMIGVELRRPVVLFADGDRGRAAATVTVRVTCDALRADIAIDDPLTGKKVGRVVDLGAAAPVARPHLLALSIVELVAASWVELVSNPHPASPAVGAVAAPAARADAVEVMNDRPGARRGPRLRAEAVAQVSGAGPTALGGGLAVGGDVGAHLGWMAGVGFQHGEQAFALGRVSVDNANALVALVARVSRGQAALRAGLGARGGGAWLTGTPADPGNTVGGAVNGAWWGPAALVDGSYALRGRLIVALTVEAGRVLLPVVATIQSGETVAIDGLWLRGALGVGFTL